MTWISTMVKRQVEKQTAELRREFSLMNQALREEMAAELQEQLRELLLEETDKTPLCCSKLGSDLRLASRWQREMAGRFKNTGEDYEDGEIPKTLAFSETHNDTNSMFILRKSLKEESLKISLTSDSSDTDSTENRNISKDVQGKPDSGTCKQQKNQSSSSDVTPIWDSTTNPFCTTQSFISSELSHEDEDEMVHGDSGKEEEALMMDNQWKEWLDKQEMKGYSHKKKAVESQRNMEKQGTAASGVSEKKKDQNLKRGDTMKRFKTYISDVFSSHSSHKWKKFENEDGSS